MGHDLPEHGLLLPFQRASISLQPPPPNYCPNAWVGRSRAAIFGPSYAGIDIAAQDSDAVADNHSPNCNNV